MAPLTNATTLKRIHREIADLKREDLGALALAPSSDSLFNWTATIPGPEGSVYEGGVFHADIVLPPDYPFSAPQVVFRTRIYHMNINERGSICIDILKHNWSPALSLFKVLLSISSLLTDPNPKDPLVPSIANEYVRNRRMHDRNARHWTELYARPTPPPSPPSTHAKGKARDVVVVSSPVSSSSRRTRGSANVEARETETIMISDDEDAPALRTRAAARRKRAREDDSDDEVEAVEDADAQRSSRPARKRRTGASSRVADNDVIVIED